ncbi:hypothetical protein BG011_004612 [Mortierella polycephala]|uniref:Uncharacterized protein n=1 Tax=Mortierella polycephala TaxID=41804 RepID=A0A9P6PZR1_9FUNG|nr:hypothetical protein BG011_004612 [Mortierella polycephala]
MEQEQEQQQQPMGGSSDATSDSRSQFWRNPGMKSLIDWYTDFDNYKRLNTVRPTADNRPGDVRKEIAAFINRAEGTNWTEATHNACSSLVSSVGQDGSLKLKRTASEGPATSRLPKRGASVPHHQL